MVLQLDLMWPGHHAICVYSRGSFDYCKNELIFGFSLRKMPWSGTKAGAPASSCVAEANRRGGPKALGSGGGVGP